MPIRRSAGAVPFHGTLLGLSTKDNECLGTTTLKGPPASKRTVVMIQPYYL